MSSRSHYGMLGAVNVHYGRGGKMRQKPVKFRLGDAQARSKLAVQKYRETVAGFDYVTRKKLAELDADMDGWEDDPALFPIPPGDEGVLASHVGGEYELCAELLQNQKVHKDNRTHRDRTESRNIQWATLIPALTDAYLIWWKERAGPSSSGSAESATLSRLSRSASSDEHAWSVTVIVFTSTSTAQFVPSLPLEVATVMLARHGYLTCSPIQPTLALSFDVLEAYHQLHGTCLRLSIQALCQGLCRLHQVLYRCHFSEQFSIAHDIYLDVLHAVDVRVGTALERTTPNWCMLNACAPCLYHLEGEGDMARSILPSMDGNSSLKLVNDTFQHGTTHPDGRTCHSDLFLAEDHVNRFKHKVAAVQKHHLKPATRHRRREINAYPRPMLNVTSAADVGDVDIADMVDSSVINMDVADVVDAATELSNDVDYTEEPCNSKGVCAERWHNAGPVACKKMFALFAATGIFTCLCRHGQVLTMCDMVQSGKL
ncbi:hypothetical protein ONZ51_g11155 [Trametes cubensis]|uniref:CxC1-like cysteine cluster associated with KDZ transposases domain-containing protein n=1 Tax=Trametes cubensis TaxID=1111947 RepID=A0AAD7X849_9APHY|nr:hypothetical protein ONZ51_g11155 [Trametes cubensis]